jgi:signal transduction histidine kinase
MTYRVLQLHHGTVDFRSAPGEGTTFDLSLPLLPARLEAILKSRNSEAHDSPATV